MPNLADGVTLVFCNLPEDDTLVCFENMSWHAHGAVTFMKNDSLYIGVALSSTS